jgi:hypothetical protein
MGLDSPSIMFLSAAKSLGVDFSKTLTLGRQDFRPQLASLKQVFEVLSIPLNAEAFLRENKYAEPFFSLLGANEVASLDVSSYEKATFIHDMNFPIPVSLRERFSVVHDGGTIEHIFHITQALKNCMEMIRVGGHFLQVNEANNFMGHGFWQISPELIFRAFSPHNGFKIEGVLLHEVKPGGAWYLVRDPDEVRGRVELCNNVPTYILTIAKRISVTNVFTSPPQQSDYVARWDKASTGQVKPPLSSSPASIVPPPHQGIRRFIPRPVKRLLRAGIDRLRGWPTFDPTHYTRIPDENLIRGKLAQ